MPCTVATFTMYTPHGNDFTSNSVCNSCPVHLFPVTRRPAMSITSTLRMSPSDCTDTRSTAGFGVRRTDTAPRSVGSIPVCFGWIIGYNPTLCRKKSPNPSS